MGYAKVDHKFWRDPRVRRWSDSTKLFAQYLLTCSHRNTEGLFWLPKDYIASDLGWSIEGISEALHTLSDEGFALYDDDTQTVLIVKAIKYDAPKGEKSVKGAINALGDVPPTPLFATLLSVARQYAPELADGIENPEWNAPVKDHLRAIEGASKGHSETPKASSSSSSPPQAHAHPPGGEAEASTNGHDPRRLAERWRDYAVNELGLQLPPAERLSERFRFVFEVMLDEVPEGDRHGNVIGFVVDYVELACGGEHKVASGERAFLARCVAEFHPLKVFDAAVESVTWGAGTGEYADHPKAVVAYMRSVLGKETAA